MEISFEKGKFVYCPGGFNYQEVLDDFKRAKKVRIITYNISGTGNMDPLLEQIKKLGEDVDVQIITNIPSRFETYYSSATGEAMRSRAKHNIEVYLKKLNPESFTTAFSISFNFFNHAKIIGTENIVYIGSANFSNESKQNIETGVIIEDSAFIARLYDEFFEDIKNNSTPFFDDDFNLFRLLTLNLIAKFTVHSAKLSDTLFKRTAYDIYDDVYFSGEDLAELVFDLQSFQDLDGLAENTYSEDDNGYNDDINEIMVRLSEIDVNWLIEIASDDGVLFNFVNFNYERTWDNCLQKYSAEAYDEYLDEYVEKAQNDTMAIYDSKKQDFEDVADIFIRGIDSIIDVLKLVEALIEKYKDTRISADIDNT